MMNEAKRSGPSGYPHDMSSHYYLRSTMRFVGNQSRCRMNWNGLGRGTRRGMRHTTERTRTLSTWRKHSRKDCYQTRTRKARLASRRFLMIQLLAEGRVGRV